MNSIAKAAVGAAVAAAVAIIGVDLLTDAPSDAESSAGTISHPAPSLSGVSSPVDLSIVNGWPGARRNPAGLYSWNVQDDRWMHNPREYDFGGSGIGIGITFYASAQDAFDRGPQAVTVADHDGTYQELPSSTGGRMEVWIVDIEDTTVTIVVEGRPETTAAELAEAHAIIASIRSEPRTKNRAGFRLIFTLPEGWDSG